MCGDATEGDGEISNDTINLFKKKEKKYLWVIVAGLSFVMVYELSYVIAALLHYYDESFGINKLDMYVSISITVFTYGLMLWQVVFL